MIQSSSAESTLRKCGTPSIRSVSNCAPDLASELRTAVRSVAPAISSAIVAATGAAGGVAGVSKGSTSGSVVTSGLHLGQQRGRPATAAEDSVSADPVTVHDQEVQLVGRVR